MRSLLLLLALSAAATQDATAQDNSSKTPGRAEVLTRAQALYDGGNAEGAFAELRAHLERHPAEMNVRLAYARLLGYSRRYVEALSEYQVVLQADPHHRAALTGVAKIYSWQGDLDAAIGGFDRVLARDPRYYDALVGKAFALLWQNRREEARSLFRLASRQHARDPEVVAALKELGPEPPRPQTPAAQKLVAKESKPAEAAAVTQSSADEKPASEVGGAIEQAVAPPPPPDPIPGLMTAAQEAAARGNLTSAVHHYNEVLQHDPQHKQARLQLARVLSWSQNYTEAAQQYAALLRVEPAHPQARQERARVLSWSKRYDEALEEYARLLAESEEEPAAGALDVRELRLEQARVLSWAQRYEESLAALDLLLPPGYTPQRADKDPIVQRARVLSWSRRYEESLAAYDAALALDANDRDALLGKAQTLYWSGRLPQAAALLRGLRQQQPENADTSFTLAAVEHGLGYNARALHLLDYVKDSDDADALRTRIHRQLRPVARFRFGLVNAREASAADPELGIPARFSTTRTLRYDTAIEFGVHPDVRMEVANSVAQNLTSNSALGRFRGDAISTQTMARLTFQLLPGLRMTAGAGGGSAGTGRDGALQQPRSYHLLYELHPSYSRGDWRLDFTATRQLADYTPLAVHQSVVQRREGGAVLYAPRRLRMGAEFWHAHYSLESPEMSLHSPQYRTTANGGSTFITPALYKDDRVTIEAGARYEVFGFEERTGELLLAVGPPLPPPATSREPGSTGFFTPRLFHRIAATGRLAWQATPKVFLDINGTFGPQRISNLEGIPGPDPAFRRTGSIGASATFTLGNFQPFVAWDYFSTDTAFGPAFSASARGGSYRSHSLVVGVARRF